MTEQSPEQRSANTSGEQSLTEDLLGVRPPAQPEESPSTDIPKPPARPFVVISGEGQGNLVHVPHYHVSQEIAALFGQPTGARPAPYDDEPLEPDPRENKSKHGKRVLIGSLVVAAALFATPAVHATWNKVANSTLFEEGGDSFGNVNIPSNDPPAVESVLESGVSDQTDNGNSEEAASGEAKEDQGSVENETTDTAPKQDIHEGKRLEVKPTPPQTTPVELDVLVSNLGGPYKDETHQLSRKFRKDMEAGIVGLQGIEDERQFTQVQKGLGDQYSSVPGTYKEKLSIGEAPIFWDDTLYDKVSSGKVLAPGEDALKRSDETVAFPYVVLQEKANQTGQVVAVINVSLVDKESDKVAKNSDVFDSQGKEKRRVALTRVREAAEQLKQQLNDQAVVLVTGDFSWPRINESESRYETLTKNSTLEHIAMLNQESTDSASEHEDFDTTHRRAVYVAPPTEAAVEEGQQITVDMFKTHGALGNHIGSIGIQSMMTIEVPIDEEASPSSEEKKEDSSAKSESAQDDTNKKKDEEQTNKNGESR